MRLSRTICKPSKKNPQGIDRATQSTFAFVHSPDGRPSCSATVNRQHSRCCVALVWFALPLKIFSGGAFEKTKGGTLTGAAQAPGTVFAVAKRCLAQSVVFYRVMSDDPSKFVEVAPSTFYTA
jgi:hypothetical protein